MAGKSKKTRISTAIRIDFKNEYGEISREMCTDGLSAVLCALNVQSISSVELDYDVILLSNYKHKMFSINQSLFKESHRISIPKSESITTAEVILRFQPDNVQLSDCLLIITPIPGPYSPRSEYHITRRFSVIHSNAQARHEYTAVKPSYETNARIGNKELWILDHNVMTNIESLSETDIDQIYRQNYEGLIFKASHQSLSIPLYYRFAEEMHPHSQLHSTALVFALENSRVVPLFGGKTYELFGISMKASNILTPTIDAQVCGNRNIILFVLNHPFTKLMDHSDFNETYLWDHVYYSEKISIRSSTD